MNKTYSWLDEFLDATQNALAVMDLATLQPTSWQHTQPLFAGAWLEWFENIIKQIEIQQMPYSKVARHFQPDLGREHLFFTLEDLKVARWPKEKRMKVANFFHQTLKEQMEPGDLFGLHGTTKPTIGIAEIMRKKFNRGTPESARTLGKLYNAAYNLGAALYLDYYMGNAVENYGPYSLGSNRILVVKEMRHLKPAELWPIHTTTADHLRLYAIYEDVKFATDLIACHGNYVGDPIAGLIKWRLEKDGKPVETLEEIRTLTQNLAENSSRQWKELLALPETELIQKSIWIRCFIFKPLCDALGLDWKPTPALLNAAKGRTLQDGWNTWRHPKTPKAQKAYWRKIWDPRIDFYPG